MVIQVASTILRAALWRAHVPLSCKRCVASLRDRIKTSDVAELSPLEPVLVDEYRAPKVRKPRLARLSKRHPRLVPHHVAVPSEVASTTKIETENGDVMPALIEKPSRKRVPRLRKKQSPAAKVAKSIRKNENDDETSSKSHLLAGTVAQETLSEVVDIEPPERVSIPHLAHGLDRVLFNPGVYYLQDPRSHVYNFDPYLQQITPVKDFNFDALTDYITSSRDLTLDELARAHDLQIVGSTSSMTGVLAQFHFFVSNWRPVNLGRLSTVFAKKSSQFTMSQRAPASIYLRHNAGIYAIDADKSLDSGETVLSFLGRSMEKMLTLDPEEFSKLKKVNRAEAPTEKRREAYHYSKIGRMLMRSQLDCNDPRLPGTGTFDLKTRAVLPVRMDVKNAHEGAGYQILQSTGLLESFEREYYDMIRAAFLKYSLQVRIGKMDGIFVAYHNTERIFGFQYISLEEMDDCIHGSSERNIAHREYIMSLRQLDRIMQLAIERYPGQSMALSFEAMEDKKTQMKIVIEPLTEEEIKSRQEGELLEALRAAQQNERIKKMPSSTQSTNSKGTLEKMSTTLENMIARGKHRAQQVILGEMAPEPTRGDSANESSGTDTSSTLPSPLVTKQRPRTMLTLTGTNVVDGQIVQGPPQPTSTSSWQFKFTVKETTDSVEIDRVMAKMRDRQAQAWTDLYEDAARPDFFRNDLRRISHLGRKKLEEKEGQRRGEPAVVFRESSSRDLEQQYRKSFQQSAA